MTIDFSTCVLCDHPNVVHHPVMVKHPALTWDDVFRMRERLGESITDAMTFTECGEPDCFCRFVDNDKELIFYV